MHTEQLPVIKLNHQFKKLPINKSPGSDGFFYVNSAEHLKSSHQFPPNYSKKSKRKECLGTHPMRPQSPSHQNQKKTPSPLKKITRQYHQWPGCKNLQQSSSKPGFKVHEKDHTQQRCGIYSKDARLSPNPKSQTKCCITLIHQQMKE